MASFKFDNLRRSANVTAPQYTYTDLHLDMNIDFKQRDIVVDYDEEAIKNSIINIFNTAPGERFLIPKFGCNLKRYLFEPVSEHTAYAIGSTILDAIKLWEPRVRIDNINVGGDPDNNSYDISFTILFPNLKKRTNLSGVLSKEGFREVNG